MPRIPSSSPRSADGGAERWVSAVEVAAHLGVRKDSIYRWIENRALPATKIGKLWKLKLSEVDAWVRAGGALAESDEPTHDHGSVGVDPAAVPHMSTVLIVDDDEDTRETLREVVTDQGYDALTAADGIEALRILRSDGQSRPDLILLDLGMPNMDGLAFLAEQKGDPTIATIPVIIITAERSRGVSEAPVLCKPLDIARVIDAIRRTVAP